MKDQFPDRAIIYIPDMPSLEMFVYYCSNLGMRWSKNNPMDSALSFVGEYVKNINGDAYIHYKHGEFGYCDRSYYEHQPLYLNTSEPHWNFCSVAEFIEWTGGYQSDEQCEIDFDSIL